MTPSKKSFIGRTLMDSLWMSKAEGPQRWFLALACPPVKVFSLPRNQPTKRDTLVAKPLINHMNQTHAVQFYLSDDFLIKSLTDFVRVGFEEQASVVMVATPTHREHLCQSIEPFQKNTDRLRLIDASELLSAFLVHGWPDEGRFRHTVGEMIVEATQAGPVHIFVEMMALLWSHGERQAAIRLEELWNHLAHDHAFSLLCAYPLAHLGRETDPESFDRMAGLHSHVRAGKTLIPI